MMDGHGDRMQRFPLTLLPSKINPFSSTKTGSTPGMGKVAKVGLAGVTPAMFEIRMPPVSVCHQVSTIGHRFLPTCSSYQCQASSFMGSPTVPRILRLSRFLPSSGLSPKPIRLRMAVGAVYKMLILCFSIMSQNRLALGQVGMPSNITLVAPALNGPYNM